MYGGEAAFAMEPDFPTPEQPHVFLADYTLELRLGQEDEDAATVLRLAREHTARGGGNALVVLRAGGARPVIRAFGLYLSLASPRLGGGPEALERRLAEALAEPGREVVVAPRVAHLDDARTLTATVTVEPGACFDVHFALDDDARWNRQAAAELRPRLVDQHEVDVLGARGGLGGDPALRREETLSLACTLATGPMRLQLHEPLATRAEVSPVRMGTGVIRFAVTRRQLSPAEVSELRVRAAPVARERVDDDTVVRRRACRTCMSRSSGCGRAAGSCAAAQACLALLAPSISVGRCLQDGW